MTKERVSVKRPARTPSPVEERPAAKTPTGTETRVTAGSSGHSDPAVTETVLADIDELLEEIDKMPEIQNAEAFVAGFVNRGGE